jgi:LytTr DNA-binding domain-containing protein
MKEDLLPPIPQQRSPGSRVIARAAYWTHLTAAVVAMLLVALHLGRASYSVNLAWDPKNQHAGEPGHWLEDLLIDRRLEILGSLRKLLPKLNRDFVQINWTCVVNLACVRKARVFNRVMDLTLDDGQVQTASRLGTIALRKLRL